MYQQFIFIAFLSLNITSILSGQVDLNLIDLSRDLSYNVLEYEEIITSPNKVLKPTPITVKVLRYNSDGLEYYFRIDEEVVSSTISQDSFQYFHEFGSMKEFVYEKEEMLLTQSYNDYPVLVKIVFVISQSGKSTYYHCSSVSSVIHLKDDSFKIKMFDGWDFSFRIGDKKYERDSIPKKPFSQKPALIGVEYYKCSFLFEWMITYDYPMFLKYIRGFGVISFSDNRQSKYSFYLKRIDGLQIEDVLTSNCN